MTLKGHVQPKARLWQYRTRVELGSTGYVAYCGLDAYAALDALHASKPWKGEHSVCERRKGHDGPWVPLIKWEGGKPCVCVRCGGTGDGTSTMTVCLGCKGRGVV